MNLANAMVMAGRIYGKIITGGGVIGGGIGVNRGIWDYLEHHPTFHYMDTPLILSMRCGHGILVGVPAGLLCGALSPAILAIGIPTMAVWWYKK